MNKKIFGVVAFALIAASLATFGINSTYAASLTSVSDTMSRMKLNTLSNHTIVFTTPSGVAAGQNITVTFPSDFAPQSGIDYTSVDVQNGATDLTLAATASGTTWGAAFSGTGNRVLTITSGTGTITAGAVVTIEVGTHATFGTTGTKQITNPTTAGSYTISLTAGASDSGSLSVAISGQDQVTSTGKVDPYIACAVTQDTVDFGTLDFNNAKTGSATMTAATNSSSGYIITLNGPTLTNGSFTIDAVGAVAASSTPGSEQFGLRISSAGGNGQAVAPYNDTVKYAFDIANLPTIVAESTQKSKTTTYTINYIANIDTDTEPGLYTATHTYICTGRY